MNIGVIGIGRLGLCFALNLDKVGFNVIAQDINPDHINCLHNKDFYSTEPFVNEMLKTSSIDFTDNLNKVINTDILFLFVNTPSNSDGSFNQQQIDSVVGQLKEYQGVIAICSTVMPGYCNSLNDSRIVYNPQFIAQGSIIKDQLNPDLVLIGTSDLSKAELVKKIYLNICKNSPNYKIMDYMSAEIAKLALNCYITTKISFANNLGDICKSVGANCEEVLSAISSDSRVGQKCFDYGYGYGGPCFPRDNKAFINFANNHVRAFLSEATEQANEDHLIQQLKLIEKGILPKNMKIFENNITINGVCFKQESKILEESQQLKLAILLSKNYNVTIVDSDIVINILKEKYKNIFKYEVIK